MSSNDSSTPTTQTHTYIVHRRGYNTANNPMREGGPETVIVAEVQASSREAAVQAALDQGVTVYVNQTLWAEAKPAADAKPAKRRTITLTDRPPVTIYEDDWPSIAWAEDSWHDGEIEVQANRRTRRWLKVRQHADGRILVYGGFDYESSWPKEPDLQLRDGQLLTPLRDGTLPTSEAIVKAIQDVSNWLSNRVPPAYEDHLGWHNLAARCVADLPAENI
jgi:hypothetical protein